jgi:hypothetical protein
MQNTEELAQKRPDRSRKTKCNDRGKNSKKGLIEVEK